MPTSRWTLRRIAFAAAASRSPLGPTEFRLLKHFLEHPGRVFSRERLLDAVWSARSGHRRAHRRRPRSPSSPGAQLGRAERPHPHRPLGRLFARYRALKSPESYRHRTETKPSNSRRGPALSTRLSGPNQRSAYRGIEHGSEITGPRRDRGDGAFHFRNRRGPHADARRRLFHRLSVRQDRRGANRARQSARSARRSSN